MEEGSEMEQQKLFSSSVLSKRFFRSPSLKLVLISVVSLLKSISSVFRLFSFLPLLSLSLSSPFLIFFTPLTTH